MKKLIVLAVAKMLCLCACTANVTSTVTTEPTVSESGTHTVVGGWTLNDDETVGALPADAQAAFEKAMEGFVGVGYTPVALLGTQVVAGTNYAILCKATTVTAAPETSLKVLIIYADLEGNASITDILDFNLTDYTDGSTEISAEMLAGGWFVPEEFSVVNLPADAGAAFTKATEGFVGNNLEPLALLGTQVVAGTNYAILCHSSLVTAEPVNGIVVVTIYADLSGNATITSISAINVADLLA